MLWRDIFKKLKKEGVVQISYEAVIKTRLVSIIGDVPIYNFEVQYFSKDDEELLRVEQVETYEELLDLIDREVAFRRCSRCGQLITEGFYHDMVRDKEFCCLNCMVDDMNEQYGVGNWRFAESEQLLNIEGHVIKNKCMFEIKGEVKNDNGESKEVWIPYKMDYCAPISFEANASDSGMNDDLMMENEGIDDDMDEDLNNWFKEGVQVNSEVVPEKHPKEY